MTKAKGSPWKVAATRHSQYKKSELVTTFTTEFFVLISSQRGMQVTKATSHMHAQQIPLCAQGVKL